MKKGDQRLYHFGTVLHPSEKGKCRLIHQNDELTIQYRTRIGLTVLSNIISSYINMDFASGTSTKHVPKCIRHR